jgi:hypothetical protein
MTRKQAPLWVVTITGDRDVHAVARDLTASGLTIDQVFDAIGSITGFADAKVIPRLRAIKGVADVSRNPSVDIGPPDAPLS